MIASLDGTITLVATDHVVLEVNGVGYRVFAGPSTLARISSGQRMKLHTHHLVREDVQALYGLSLIHISEPTRLKTRSRMPSSA